MLYINYIRAIMIVVFQLEKNDCVNMILHL